MICGHRNGSLNKWKRVTCDSKSRAKMCFHVGEVWSRKLSSLLDIRGSILQAATSCETSTVRHLHNCASPRPFTHSSSLRPYSCSLGAHEAVSLSARSGLRDRRRLRHQMSLPPRWQTICRTWSRSYQRGRGSAGTSQQRPVW